jgi:ATP-dependent Lon protease
LKLLKMTDGSETIIVHGLSRVGIERITHEVEFLEALVHAREDPTDVSVEQKALMQTVRRGAARIIELSPNIPDEAREVLNNIETPGGLADFLAANLSIDVIHKQELLETFDVPDRLRKVNLMVATQLQVLELSNKIQKQVEQQVDRSQREYYLREQMKAIEQELGEGGAPGKAAELRERIKAVRMPETAAKEAEKEVDRLERIPPASPEYSMALDYIDWLVGMPWSKSTEDHLDVDRARDVLDEDHYGLDKIKKRILEFLAVRKLKPDSRGPILCFTGPPGVGKTSLGQSIARAMGRKFIRMSLGGIRDEATIRGHRRTYIGSMPGRIVREIRRAESNNPLFMLDEVDKIGQDVRGDPMSALLEVLDPAQNSTFVDHYLGLPFDLSRVLFIGTANYKAAIERALLDRMEVIELPGYTHNEKLMIATRYLLPRQIRENGLTPQQLQLPDEVLSAIITDYTREAGVRNLERNIGSICRAQATAVARGESPNPTIHVDQLRTILGPKQFESEVAATRSIPGVVTGLAFTPTGGEILFIEATKMPGRGELGLTGQLGDIMRESAYAARSIIRGRAGKWAVKPDTYRQQDIHVHVPAGAIPKDGPSAGVAMLAAMASVLLNRTVDPRIGMTGEITLSGRVLPVGGIREKVLAAHRAGLKSVILPKRNLPHLEEVPQEVRQEIEFVPVESIDELFDFVFDGRKPTQGPKKPRATSDVRRKAGSGKTRKKATRRRFKTRKHASSRDARKTKRRTAR